MFNWAYLDNEATLNWVAFLYGFYLNLKLALWFSEGSFIEVLSVTILETTKTNSCFDKNNWRFYRSQFWRLQKPVAVIELSAFGFIGHNFGDYKNDVGKSKKFQCVLSVTILETTKTQSILYQLKWRFYRSQFWRLQKPQMVSANDTMKVRSYSAFQAE